MALLGLRVGGELQISLQLKKIYDVECQRKFKLVTCTNKQVASSLSKKIYDVDEGCDHSFNERYLRLPNFSSTLN